MSRIKDYIAEHEADIIADIKALVQKQSPTAHKEAVDAQARNTMPDVQERWRMKS